MRKLAAITMSALISLAPSINVALAQGRARATKIEQQASPGQPVKRTQWKKGGKYTGRGAIVTDHGRYKLKKPPEGHRWVREGDEFILVAIGTGLIASIAKNARK